MYLPIALFFTATTAKKWSCDAPLVATACVKSSWTGWKSDRSKFQKKCNGNLVRWGKDSGVKDCGIACFGCSYIKACCDTCTTIKSVVGSWAEIRCVDVDFDVTHTYGVTATEEGSWSRTEEWSQSVSAKATASGMAYGVMGTVELSAEARHGLTIQTSTSWSVTTTDSTTDTFRQAAHTCSWVWQTHIEDSCGSKVALSEDFIITSGPSRGNSPCCLPGIEQDENGNCMPDNDGQVVSLCPPPKELEELEEL